MADVSSLASLVEQSSEIRMSKVVQVVGVDLGDKKSQFCVMDLSSGVVEEETRLPTTRTAFERRFGGVARMRIALEVGTHSPWVSRLLSELGHEVIVANPRKLRLIYENRRKTDKVDAEMLARVARLDPALLFPIRHRSGNLQADLAVLRARQSLVKARAQQINHVRGAVKSIGERLPKCSTGTFAKKVEGALPAELELALSPILEVIAELTRKIKEYDKRLEQMADESYPESMLLRQVRGVGVLTALAYLLVIGDPSRFQKSRTVGAYLGLTPGLDESGDTRRVLRISKEGDRFLRSLLVQCAHYILGHFGEDCDLRRHGESIMQGGGRSPKKRAAVAVARKLAVLLHRLWRNGEVYDPFHNAKRQDRRLRRTA